MSYDIIGDVHGHADKLESLLAKLGYSRSNGCWRHPRRKAIFLGDFIDRGPCQLRSVEIPRRMVAEGAALAVMGNHEFNAIAWSHAGPWTVRRLPAAPLQQAVGQQELQAAPAIPQRAEPGRRQARRHHLVVQDPPAVARDGWHPHRARMLAPAVHGLARPQVGSGPPASRRPAGSRDARTRDRRREGRPGAICVQGGRGSDKRPGGDDPS